MLIKKLALQGNHFQSSEKGLCSEEGRDLSPFFLPPGFGFHLRTKVVCGVGPVTFDTQDFSVGSALVGFGALDRGCVTHIPWRDAVLYLPGEWNEGTESLINEFQGKLSLWNERFSQMGCIQRLLEILRVSIAVSHPFWALAERIWKSFGKDSALVCSPCKWSNQKGIMSPFLLRWRD